MGKIKDIVKALYSELEIANSNMNKSEDEYEKVGYQYQIIGIKEKIDNAKSELKKYVNAEQIQEICEKVLPTDVLEKANKDLLAKNEWSKNAHDTYFKSNITNAKENIKRLLQYYPNCVNEGDKKHEEYQRNLKNIETNQYSLDHPTYKVYTLYDVLGPEHIDKVSEEIAENIENSENADEIFDKIKNFKPIDKSDLGVTYPIKDKLEEILKNPYTNYDFRQLIIQNKDLMNELTAEDSNASVQKLYNSYVKEIETLVDRKVKRTFIEAATEKNLLDIVEKKDNSFKVKTQKDLDRVFNDDFKFQYSEETKNTFKHFLNEMNYKDMLPEHMELNEEGTKVYSYTKFLNAKKEFIKAVMANGDDFNADLITYRWNELLKEVRKINEMEEIINVKIGTSYDAMPTNVDVFRNPDIPRRFKNNLAHNEQMNNLYMVAGFLRHHDITIERFLDEPTTVIKDIVKKEAERLNADNIVKDMNKGQAIFALADKNVSRGFGTYGFLRAVEFLNGIEKNPEYRKNNNLVVFGMNAAFGNIKFTIDKNYRYFEENSANISETLQNVFMAEKDPDSGKILYSKCYAQRAGFPNVNIEGDDYTDILTDAHTGFEVKDQPTVLDKVADLTRFEQTFVDAQIVIKQYYQASLEPKNAGIEQNISLKNLVKATQELIVKYLYTHDVEALNKEAAARDDDPVVPDSFMEEMLEFITNPKISGVFMQDMGNPDLIKLIKDKKTLFVKKENDMIKSVTEKEKEFIKKIKNLNKQIDKIEAQVDKVSSKLKLRKGETSEKIEELGMKERQLFNEILKVQNERIEELKKEYETGKITKYYFEKRVEQLNTMNMENFTSLPQMFQINEPAYKTFKEYKKNFGDFEKFKESLSLAEKRNKTEDDLKKEFENKLEEDYQKLQADKTKFLADRVLANNGIKALKSLDSTNKYAVSAQLVKVTDYKEIYDDILYSETKAQNDASKVQEIIVPEAAEEEVNEISKPLNEEDVKKDKKLEIGETFD